MSNSPSTYWGERPFLFKAANARLLIVCTCLSCRRTVTYKAVDLLHVHRPNQLVGELWGCCPRCGSFTNWSETQRYPTSDDVGHLVVRRPSGYRRVLQWTDEFYAPPPYGPPWPPPLDLEVALKGPRVR